MEKIYGPSLRTIAEKTVGKTLPRKQTDDVLDFIRHGDMRYIGIISGLAMTGKTNLLHHVMLKMTDEEIAHTGFITLSANDTWDMLDAGIRQMQMHNINCILIDEITEVKNFISKSIDLANVFSNLYGIKIVCSGSGSLALHFAGHDSPISLKSKIFDLTFLPFHEWRRLLCHLEPNGKYTLVEYMEHGGILGTLDEIKLKCANYDFNAKSWKPDAVFPFQRWKDDEVFYKKYFNQAIVSNLQNGLMCKAIADAEFANIAMMFHKKKLTDAFQRIVCDIYHSITDELFNRSRLPNIIDDIYINLYKKEEICAAEILMSKDFRKHLEEHLGIYFSTQDGVSDKEKKEIIGYLKKINVLSDIDVETTVPSIDISHRVILTLPGLKRQFCDEVMCFLRNYQLDEYWSCLEDQEKQKAVDTIRGAFYGRMFEDCILYECMCKAREETKATGIALHVYRFENSKLDAGSDVAWGEFDMVVRASSGGWTRYALFEAKCTASAKEAERHCQHLRKEALLREACPDGRIALRAVLYNGGPTEVSGGVLSIPAPIRYMNASQFLADVARHGLLPLFGPDRPQMRLNEMPEDAEQPLPQCQRLSDF